MTRSMKILVVAPEYPGFAKLGWLREVFAIKDIPGAELEVVGGEQATLSRVAARLGQPADVIVWSGHGRANGLVLADGVWIDGEWLACQVRPAAVRVVVLAACLSGAKDPGLDSLVGALSGSGISAVGMAIEVEDMAASAYVIEFVRALAAGADVGRADRVAGRMMAAMYPAMAGAAALTPGLTNGYSLIDRRLARLEQGFGELAAKLDVVCELLRVGREENGRGGERDLRTR